MFRNMATTLKTSASNYTSRFDRAGWGVGDEFDVSLRLALVKRQSARVASAGPHHGQPRLSNDDPVEM